MRSHANIFCSNRLLAGSYYSRFRIWLCQARAQIHQHAGENRGKDSRGFKLQTSCIECSSGSVRPSSKSAFLTVYACGRPENVQPVVTDHLETRLHAGIHTVATVLKALNNSFCLKSELQPKGHKSDQLSFVGRGKTLLYSASIALVGLPVLLPLPRHFAGSSANEPPASRGILGPHGPQPSQPAAWPKISESGSCPPTCRIQKRRSRLPLCRDVVKYSKVRVIRIPNL